jgi:tetratricopeptide (TPR) repeat protein
LREHKGFGHGAYLYTMQRRIIFLLILFCHFTTQTPAAASQFVFEYNENCSRAYENYLSLHVQEAREIIISEMKTNPYNLMATYLSDYEDCIVLLLNCDKTEYDDRAGHLDTRIALLENGDHNSPWYRFCKAGIYLHWAIVKMRFGEQYSAAVNFHRSFAMLKDNKRLFPAFEYNQVFGGLEEAVVGSIPGSYKWLAGVFGMKGNVKNGTEKLGTFINTHHPNDPLYTETLLYYLYTRFYLLMEQKEVWNFLSSAKFNTHNNLLNTFVKVNIALDHRKSDAAIETLQAAAHDLNYYRYPVFDYQMGMALLTKGDTLCARYFRQFLKKNKSDLYIKDCWQKMALTWYIAGDMQQASYCKEQAKLQGSTRLDADKQAARFAESTMWPLKKLLQGRLMTDGGYYAQAQAILNSIDTNSLTNPADRGEYYFRMGRVLEESENSKALDYYQSAINAGNKRHEQFAARAALQMGKMYEHMGMTAQAKRKYEECLDMPSHDFQNSIDQQAKAGINRMEH